MVEAENQMTFSRARHIVVRRLHEGGDLDAVISLVQYGYPINDAIIEPGITILMQVVSLPFYEKHHVQSVL